VRPDQGDAPLIWGLVNGSDERRVQPVEVLEGAPLPRPLSNPGRALEDRPEPGDELLPVHAVDLIDGELLRHLPPVVVFTPGPVRRAVY